MDNKKYAEIVPILRLPKRLGVFDYSIPRELLNNVSVGDRVTIPFGKKNVDGIVTTIKNRASEKIPRAKDIISLYGEKLLLPYQIKLAFWMAQYYFQSPASIFNAILPKIPKRAKIQVQTSFITQHANTKQSKKIIIGNINSRMLANEINKYILQDKQVLMLLPEISSVAQMVFNIKKYFSSDIFIAATSAISPAKIYDNWRKIFYNKVKIVVGTRKSVFFPYYNLGLIVICNEEDMSYKQWDQNPRYHTRDVALKISELTRCDVILQSLAPSVATYSKIFKGFTLEYQKHKTKTQLVDMRNEKKYKQYSIISSKLQNELKQLKDQAILIVNSKGFASFVHCSDCGFIPACEHCSIPYSYHTYPSTLLMCKNCKISKLLELLCPRCKNPKFTIVGYGTQKVLQEIQRIIPHKACERVDNDVPDSQMQEIIKKFITKKIQILIATNILTSELPIDYSVAISAIVSADTFLSIPHYLSHEKTFQIIQYVKSLGGKSIIQTHNPKNAAIALSVKDSFEAFYKKELSERKKFHYPPFSKFIKIISQDASEASAEKQLDDLSKKISTTIKENSYSHEIIGPIKPYHSYVRARHRSQLLVRIHDPRDNLEKIIKEIPEHFLVDVDPVQID